MQGPLQARSLDAEELLRTCRQARWWSKRGAEELRVSNTLLVRNIRKIWIDGVLNLSLAAHRATSVMPQPYPPALCAKAFLYNK